ncbi:MAG: hypothetical protein GWM92_08200 [Gemmatimonadetes bacterium]|nr:hypothetical protein [Gemmatimonadota bacterium]NIR78624.1 hypothetical protein [Gemmatimonadota bacterium]NIT87242.1 hypothetical protein [Gemmatimonadota bacterium]NIU31085.1 hypothetical protein [Gemmatimonadota bacterium]NIU35821.1 hypothetical protein [Gemmatimonadota bacterium]
MQVMPVDLTEIVAIVMGISIILIPILGLTARFALKPTVEALSKFFESKGAEETIRILERRVGLLEQQVESMESTVRHLEEVSEFQSRLRAGDGEE